MKFHDSTYFKRIFHSGLDHIKFVENYEFDSHLNMVIETMVTHHWFQKYGLSLEQTMNLDYSEYKLMEERIKKYQETVNTNAATALNSLNLQP